LSKTIPKADVELYGIKEIEMLPKDGNASFVLSFDLDVFRVVYSCINGGNSI